MANGIRTGDPHGFNKGCSSKFHEGSWVRQTPEGQRTYRLKRCGNNNKDEDNSLKNLNDKNILPTRTHTVLFCPHAHILYYTAHTHTYCIILPTRTHTVLYCPHAHVLYYTVYHALIHTVLYCPHIYILHYAAYMHMYCIILPMSRYIALYLKLSVCKKELRFV